MLCHMSSNFLQPICFSNANNKHVQRIPGVRHDTHRQPCSKRNSVSTKPSPMDSRCHFKSNEKAEYPTDQASYSSHYLQEEQSARSWNGSARRMRSRSDRLSGKVFGTRNTNEIFRHLKYIKKASRIPKTVKYKEESASTTQSKAKLFNSFFPHCVCSKSTIHCQQIPKRESQTPELQSLRWNNWNFFGQAWHQVVPGPQQSTASLLQSNKETIV